MRVKSPVAGSVSSSPGPSIRTLALGGADGEQAGGAAGDVGEVDRLGVGREIGPLDRLEIDEIVDQREQMAAGGGDVAGIAGIIAAQRPFRLGAQPLGIVDDMGERRAQRLVEPLAEGGDSRAATAAGGAGAAALGAQADGGAAKAGEAAHAVDQGHAGQQIAALAAGAQLGDLAFEAAMLGERGEQAAKRRPRSRESGTGG